MATSSERSPPPFPDSEDQDLEPEELAAQDSDDGEDIFLDPANPLEAKMDPAVPENDITEPPRGSIDEPTSDLFGDPLAKHVSQIENVVATQPDNKLINELTDAVEETKATTEEPSDRAEAASVISEVTEDIIERPNDPTDVVQLQTEEPSDKAEVASYISEVTDDNAVELNKDELSQSDGAEAASSSIAELSKNIIEGTSDITEPPTGYSEPAIDTDYEQQMIIDDAVNEASSVSAPILDIFSDSVSNTEQPPQTNVIDPLSDILMDVPLSEIIAPVVNIASVNITSESPRDLLEDEPIDLITSEAPRDLMEDEPIDLITNEAPRDLLEDEPIDLITNEAPRDLLEDEPIDLITSEAPRDLLVDEPIDLITSEAPRDLLEDEPIDLMDVPVIPVSEITAPVVNITSEPPRDLFEDEPSDLFAEPLLKNSAKKDSTIDPPSDLFEEEPSDLFAEPLQKNPVKQQEISIFNEPEEDLFKEPIGGTSTKSRNVTFNEVPDEKYVDAKAGSISGPLSDNYMEDPTDIFAEEGLATAPSALTTNSVNSTTNGVHSDEESDIFAEATVELSLDSPRNDRKNKEMVAPSVSAPSISTTASLPKPQSTTAKELEEEESGDKFEMNISITNPEKVGDGMNAYMGYKVSTQTTLPMFRSKTFTVRRRFSDFLGLYEKLSEKHAQNGYIVPPPPEKSILGMTKVKVGKEDPSSAEFVERRRAALERYLQRVVCHPSLLQDPDVREFLEREELPRAVGTQALSGAGFLKMISKATDAVSKMTIKMNESDAWFEEKLLEVESEDQQLRKLHAMVDSLVNHRKELSVNTAGFAKSVAMLGSSEDNTALSRALSQLAEVEDKMEQLHQEQASNDSFTLAEMLADYIRLLGSVRGCFDQRMKAWQRWQDSQNMLQKKRETEAKLLWANKPDKLQQAKEEIAEWEAKVTQYERDFDRVSATVRKEVLRFEKEKARDFKQLVVKYLEALLLSQQQLIKYWEAFLPEAKAIA